MLLSKGFFTGGEGSNQLVFRLVPNGLLFLNLSSVRVSCTNNQSNL